MRKKTDTPSKAKRRDGLNWAPLPDAPGTPAVKAGPGAVEGNVAAA